MTVRFASVDDISQIVKTMGEVGLHPNVSRLEHFFFHSHVKGWEPKCRGGIVVEDNGGIVGYCGLSPVDMYLGKDLVPGYIMGVLGLKPGYGAAMFEMMDMVHGLTKDSMIIANTANEKSVKLWTGYGGFTSGSENCATIQYALLPMGVMTLGGNFESGVDFSDVRFQDFWQKLLDANRGLMIDRSPERLNWVFGKAIEERRNLLIVDEGDDADILGYAVIRRRKLPRLPKYRYEILDICALDSKARWRLVKKCRRYAAMHGGMMLEYVGGDSLLPKKRPALANTFFWASGMEKVCKCMAGQEFAFFGPYEGDRVL